MNKPKAKKHTQKAKLYNLPDGYIQVSTPVSADFNLKVTALAKELQTNIPIPIELIYQTLLENITSEQLETVKVQIAKKISEVEELKAKISAIGFNLVY